MVVVAVVPVRKKKIKTEERQKQSMWKNRGKSRTD